jgi:hypothetical protein
MDVDDLTFAITSEGSARNFKRGGCIVEDDGEGIPPVEFEVTGGLGKPHRMSPLEIDSDEDGMCISIQRILD